jgi:hypothetical protein
MKIWNGYGSEHSMNLVLIGKFKQAQDANKVKSDIEKLSEQADKDGYESIAYSDPEDQRFSKEMISLLRSLNRNTLAPNELGQLLSEYHLECTDEKITITTDEADISAFVKLFIEAGAKVEVFSAHDYPSDYPYTR